MSYPNIWYVMDITRIVCPHAMKPLSLFIVRKFLHGDVAGSLLHYQREAHRVGTETIPEETPLLGTPAHCIVGSAPPWLTRKGVSRLPVAIQLVTERHMSGKHLLAQRMFAGECVQVFRARGMKPAKRSAEATVFHRTSPVSYDVLYVYAVLIKGENPASQYFQARYVAASHEIVQAIMNGGVEEAERIVNRICDAIEASSEEH